MNFNCLKRLQSLLKIHLNSYNQIISQGFYFLRQKYFTKIKFIKYNSFKGLTSIDFYLSNPIYQFGTLVHKILPRQCKELKITYQGEFIININIQNNEKNFNLIYREGDFPIMIKSLKCNLYGLKPHQLTEIDEEEFENGGYFITNGTEKLIRLIIVPRRNYIFTSSKISNTLRGKNFSSFACSIRCVNRYGLSRTFHLHYLTNGSILCRFIIRNQEFFFPVVIILKAIKDVSDTEIFKDITNNLHDNNMIKEIGIKLISDSYNYIKSNFRDNYLEYIGKLFKIFEKKIHLNNLETGKNIIEDNLFIHVENDLNQKYLLLIYMIQKLIRSRMGLNLGENPDSIEFQEILLSGNIIGSILEKKLSANFDLIKIEEFTNIENSPIHKTKLIMKVFSNFSVGIRYLISSGNVPLISNFEIPQTSGFNISIERNNYSRFLSFFRSIHRGKYFTTLKSTSGRKLMPSNWGYLCPIHTPDGSLCGILNHLTISSITSVVNPIEKKNFFEYVKKHKTIFDRLSFKNRTSTILLDGKIIGFSNEIFLKWFTDKIRCEKVSDFGIFANSIEIICLKNENILNLFELKIYSNEARLLRPVRWNSFKSNFNKTNSKNQCSFTNKFHTIELIGSLEQSYLNIHQLIFTKKGEICLLYTHYEIDNLNIFSIVPGCTPFFDMNQSPRNMYQCQMAKQSIGIPFHNIWRKMDSKIYFLFSVQIPICRNKINQDGLGLDNFINGFNAVVGVLSYSSFDMEDAVVFNKSSIERGLGMSYIYNTSNFDVNLSMIKNFDKNNSTLNYNCLDGICGVGNTLKKKDIILLNNKLVNNKLVRETTINYNNDEIASVDCVKILKNNSKIQSKHNVMIRLKSKRKPIEGDKFASRHGQKGILSFKYEVENLPFSETGIIPDILFNPHGFPSRMTIGMVIESLSGKSGALNGNFNDSSPFASFLNYNKSYIFGEFLRENGFEFYGKEMFYSGFIGLPLQTDVFVGVIHYQRLKHMILDKFQVSNNSARNHLTRQPIKGRKLGGSIRLGEMERDALLGHGCIFLLHEKMQKSSDLHGIFIENTNSDIKDLLFNKYNYNSKFLSTITSYPRKIFIPYVLRYLICELSVLNLNLRLIL